MTWATYWLSTYWPLVLAAVLFAAAVVILTRDRR